MAKSKMVANQNHTQGKQDEPDSTAMGTCKVKKRKRGDEEPDAVAIPAVVVQAVKKRKKADKEPDAVATSDLVVNANETRKKAVVEPDAIAISAVVMKANKKRKKSVQEAESTAISDGLVTTTKRPKKSEQGPDVTTIAKAVAKTLKTPMETLEININHEASQPSPLPKQNKKELRTAPSKKISTVGDAKGDDVDRVNSAGMGNKKAKGKGKGKSKAGGEKKPWSNPAFRVFVHNLPQDVDDEVLRKDFAECGELADVYMPKCKNTGGTRGFGFITFRDMAGVEAALEYHGEDYGGKTLRVERAADKGTTLSADGRATGGGQTDRPEGCTSLVAKRLSPEVTKADLEHFFAECGKGSKYVGLLLDKDGKSRCTARVDFGSEADLDEAMALTAELKGRPFLMNYCQPKTW